MSEFCSLQFEKTGELVKFRELGFGAYFWWSVVGLEVSVKIDTDTYINLEEGRSTGLPVEVYNANLEAGCLPLRVVTADA